MSSCKKCGSGANNPHLCGRDDTDLDLCDVCYWRKKASDVLTDIADLVSWHCDKEADEANTSPEDTAAHVNGLVFQKCNAMLDRLELK